MANRPGRRRLPFPLSNRGSDQINNQKHPGHRSKRQIRAKEKDGPAWIMYYLETDNGQFAQLYLNELEKFGVY